MPEEFIEPVVTERFRIGEQNLLFFGSYDMYVPMNAERLKMKILPFLLYGITEDFKKYYQLEYKSIKGRGWPLDLGDEDSELSRAANSTRSIITPDGRIFVQKRQLTKVPQFYSHSIEYILQCAKEIFRGEKTPDKLNEAPKKIY